ncbi:MAG TPA: N-acetyltransferase [Acidobacteriota bacterium]|nr:N-acetyltransferase [Acidobacteriota bacterium]
MKIRYQEEGDREAVRAVNEAAFETAAEADLVERLGEQARPLLSLVAEQEGRVVGHILFTPVSLSGHPGLRIMGLAPMAVLPGQQRRGIGSALVREGLRECRRLGAVAVVVLGHPRYYPRFGFDPSSRFGIDCEYEVPEEAFMVLELSAGALEGREGTIRYHEAFRGL